MMKTIGWKLVLIVAVIVASVILVYPPGEKINLGLDLKGGMHLVFSVKSDEAIKMQTENEVARLKKDLSELSIKFEKIVPQGTNKIDIIGTVYDDEGKIKELLDDQYRDWDNGFTSTGVSLSLRPNVEVQLKDQTVVQALETIRNRVDEFGVAEPVFQRQGSNHLLIELPGVSDKEKTRVMNLIKSTAMLEFKKEVAGPFDTEEIALQQYNGILPEDLVILKWGPRSHAAGKVSVMQKVNVITGRDLKVARRSMDRYGGPAVDFTLSSGASSRFRTFTAANVGQKLAIILDGRIITDPTIQDVLSFGGQITGGFSVEEADDLALKLRSGALPAPLEMEHEQIIGPSLGADSIRKGLIACIAGLLLVVAFMLVYYKGAGVNSVLALILNMVILMGILAAFRATLTLPGIAGIILTIGMAVDANVLVFERIKEELNLGKSPKSAIEAGFKKAFWTIFDSNLTTVIAAIFLFQFGTSSIKGFAVTLIIGIAASMFTAIFVSRVIFELTYARQKKLTKISI